MKIEVEDDPLVKMTFEATDAHGFFEVSISTSMPGAFPGFGSKVSLSYQLDRTEGLRLLGELQEWLETESK